MTARARPLSEKALRATIEEVVRTGAAVTIRTRDVVCEIRPPEPKPQANPADLVDMSE